ncbi:MAG: hypothetical protein EPGJADBJ_02008 [Saprospiraceae bacterium]|nr:hypothetical protein [Saprospiraceae bacterium]
MEVIPTANFQPDVSLWGLRVGEPVIALTSVLISLFCFYAWMRLGKISQPNDALRLFRVFFMLTGLSTLIGGLVGHAFLHHFSVVFKMPGWVLGMIAVSALEQVSIMRSRSFLGREWVRALGWLNIAQLTVALSVVFITLWFPVVEIHSAFGFLLVIAPLEARMFLKDRSAVSRFILWGILLLVGAVAVHILKISAGVWFCYFDIAHLFMCAAVWMFMTGAERLPKYEA